MDPKKELDAIAQGVSLVAAVRARQALRRIDEPTATERALGITRQAIAAQRVARKFAGVAAALADVSRVANEAARRLAVAIAASGGSGRSAVKKGREA